MPVARGRTAPPPSAGRQRLPDVCRRAGFIDRVVSPDTAPPDTAPPDPTFHPDCKPLTSAGDGPRATSIREERAQPNRRAGAHTLADPVGQRKSTGPARMTGYQPDPPRTGRAEMACRRMPAGGKMRGRPAMGRIIAFAAGRPRRLAIVHHFSTPYSCRCLCRQPDFAGAPTIRRRRPCRSDGQCLLPVPPVIPVGCVLVGSWVRCRTGRTPHHRLSHLDQRKERASFG